MKQLSACIVVLALSAAVGSEALEQERARSRARVKGSPATRAFVWKGMGRGYLGVQVLGLTPELRRHFGAPEDRGVLVARVDEGSPAADVGVLVGDILTEIEGHPITGPHGLTSAVRPKKSGEQVGIELLRDGGALDVLVDVEERDRPIIDLAGLEALPELAPLPGLPEAGLFISPDGPLDEKAVEAFEEAMKDLEDRFQSEEWKMKLKRIEELDLSQIQDRMKEVEDRLRALEAELEKEGKKKLD